MEVVDDCPQEMVAVDYYYYCYLKVATSVPYYLLVMGIAVPYYLM